MQTPMHLQSNNNPPHRRLKTCACFTLNAMLTNLNSSESPKHPAQPYLVMVIPCYNEEEMLHITARALSEKISELMQFQLVSDNSCVLFVDDGSKDRTWQIIEELHKQYPSMFHGLKLAHNKGHQNALYSGLMQALDMNADVAVSMDADLQDDPNAINSMIEAYEKGAEIVYGVRDNRDTDSAFKRGTARMFYRVMRSLGTETVPDHADFRLMSRRALSALAKYKESNLFLRGIVPSLGFTTAKVYYKRGKREAGESKYPLKKMISFAVEGITSFSTKPLSIITGLGILSVLAGIAMLIYTIVSVCTGHAVAGWGSLMFSLWFVGGLILVSLGVIGEYIAKVYIEVKNRPRYIVEEFI